MTPVMRSVFDDMPPDITDMSFPGLWDLGKKAMSLRLLGKDDMMDILRIVPMCVADYLNEWFKSDLLKAALAGPCIYNSYTGPWSPGTNANMLMIEALAEAPVIGGAAAVAAAMEAAAKGSGAEISLNTKVKRLLFKGKKVTGVTTASGESFHADIVAASCHPQRLFLDLIPPEYLEHKFEHDVCQIRSRGTMAKLHLALRDYPAFACRPGLKVEYIRSGESLDEMEKAFDPVKYRESTKSPLLDMYVPTLESPALAPNGQHVLSVQAHFFATKPEGGWTVAAKEQAYQAILGSLRRYVPQIKELILGYELLTPADLEERYDLPGGQVFHGEHSADQLLVRPIQQCSRYITPYEGLYLCGSGSHPGGGVTGAPGALAAKTILGR
jgi:phytoene dehydrogenase-like protein